VGYYHHYYHRHLAPDYPRTEQENPCLTGETDSTARW
jgi:hypothetical protein